VPEGIVGGVWHHARVVGVWQRVVPTVPHHELPVCGSGVPVRGAKVLFPPPHTDSWIEQVCGISHSLLQFDRIHTYFIVISGVFAF
jgi:hypothetical protein